MSANEDAHPGDATHATPTHNEAGRSVTAPVQILVERGDKPELAIVAFSGHGAMVSGTGFDFAGVCKTLRYSRILLRDDSLRCFTAGIPGLANSADELNALLRRHLAELQPERVMTIGSSAGGHAAIKHGHLLGADYVHAFSPYCVMGEAGAAFSNDDAGRAREAVVDQRIRALGPEHFKYLDLRTLLAEWNGKTRYNLYACEQSPIDVMRARLLAGMPAVKVHMAPCDTHRLAQWLAVQRRLLPLLRDETQEYIASQGAGESPLGL